MTEKAKVLVVDDDHKIRELMTDTLSALGYTTFGAKDGKEALSFLKTQKMDLVIADIRMPQLDGISLLKTIKNQQPDLPVLIITGYDFNYAMDQALDGGADGFLAKPFRIGKIEELIKSVLGIKTPSEEKAKVLSKKILVVENDPTLRKMLLETLSSLDYQPMGAENGEEALNRMDQEKFDLVITDIRMPRMDGITLVKNLREKKSKIPVIVVTGYPKAYPAEKILQVGADGYLAKPFKVQKIDELMQSLLEEEKTTV